MLRFAITGRTLFEPCPAEAPGGASPDSFFPRLIARCAAVASGGVDFLLIREKDLPAAALVQLCREVRAALRDADPASTIPTRILVASRPDIALAAALDGVHLASHGAEFTPGQVRDLFHRRGLPEPFVSISCHSTEEAGRAREAGANAALFAPVFGKFVRGEQVTPPAGLEALRAACAEAHPMPVFALGGVTEGNAPQCVQAGAAGIAGIRLFLQP